MAEVYADSRDFQSLPISGVDEVHAAFFEESRTRGRSRMTRGRKPGFASVGMTSLRAAPWFELVDGAGQSRSLHYAPPDFLLRLVALAKFLRLSLKKAAYAAVVEGRVAGNPGSLRSG